MKNRGFCSAINGTMIPEWTDEIISYYLNEVGNVNLPINERMLVGAVEKLKGVKIDLKEIDTVTVRKNEGTLMPMKGRFVLKYGANQRRRKERIFNAEARKRFTICHELGHILFYDCSSTIPKLSVIPQEHICHKIARELLLPEDTLRRRVNEEYHPNAHSIRFLRQLAKDAKVALYPVAVRLTEDLSLLRDAMITFWTYRGHRTRPEIQYDNFAPDSKSCPELRRLLPKYWRRRIHVKAWDEVVRRVVTSGINFSKKSLCIEGKRRKEGRAKDILFDIECEKLMHPNQQSMLRWTNQTPVPNVISVEKFDVDALKKGK